MRDAPQRQNLVAEYKQGSWGRPSFFLGTIMVLVLGALVPLIVTVITPDPQTRGEDLGLIAICVFGGIMLAYIVGSQRRRPYEMVVWVFLYVFLGIAPLVQIRTGVDPGTTLGIDHSLVGRASLIVIVGGLALLVGTQLASLRGVGPQAKTLKPASREPEKMRVYILSIACLMIFSYYALNIGPANLFLPRTDLGILRDSLWPDKTMNAVIGAAASMGLLVSMIALIQLRKQQKLDGHPRAFFLPGIVLVALLVCVNPISTPRYVFGTAILALLAAVGLYATAHRVRILALSFVGGLIFVFPGLDAFRNSLSGNAESTDTLTSLTTGDFDAFAQIVNTVEYVQTHGIAWGNQFTGVLFFWVPRSIWEGKAVDTGTLLANMKGYWFTNLSAPLWAEFYINGGWVALVVGMLALGFGIRRWDSRLDISVNMGVPAPILSYILPFYGLILLRGSLLQAVAFLAVILVCSTFVRPRRHLLSDRPKTGHKRLHLARTMPVHALPKDIPVYPGYPASSRAKTNMPGAE